MNSTILGITMNTKYVVEVVVVVVVEVNLLYALFQYRHRAYTEDDFHPISGLI